MHSLRKFGVTFLGFALLAGGLAMMVLPGPGILLIVAGLAVLATEYVWARRMLVKAKKQAQHVQEEAVSSPLRTTGSLVFAGCMVALGAAMLFIDDVSWPFADPTIDKIWSPVTGGILVVTGLVLAVTTYLTLRAAKGKETTYTGRRNLTPTAAGSTSLDAR